MNIAYNYINIKAFLNEYNINISRLDSCFINEMLIGANQLLIDVWQDVLT